jgi:excisionase family DNA binding protein
MADEEACDMEPETGRGGGVRRPITREDVMTAAEVGELLGIPTSTVYGLARNGTLPSARLGRTVRFLRDDVEGVLRGL